MKYYILLIYLLAFSLATEGNTAVKDSLSEALPSASSPLQKLEIMTNLMDLSRQEEQVEYAKQLYWLALEEDEDYYKEAALTEILRFYVNTDAKDSAKVYLAEAERELKGKARDFQFDLTENIVLTLKDKIDCLDSLHRYKDAYEAYKEYSVLLDSARTRSMENKVEDLEIKKYVDELVVEKKALEIDLQKSRSQLYLFLALLILSICFGIFIFFRLGKIKSLYKELQESNRLVIIASEKAQESERMKNAFIKNMCHEVRTPLNAINGFAELITSDGISPEEKKEFSKIIYTNCHNITSMMNDVLVIAQLDSSNEVLPLEPVHISLLCHHEMNKLKKLQQKPDIHYQVEGDKSNDLIYSDPNHFGIIISHLLNNANKFTNQGSITLSYRPEEEGRIMCICVTDTGCGIPADKSEWIFERFTKNDDFIPGSGLGLYLCRLITQRLNGSLKLDTCYTGGARFILRLPINPYK